MRTMYGESGRTSRLRDPVRSSPPDTTPKVSPPVEGRVNIVKDGCIKGWAWCPGRPGERVEIEVLVEGMVVAHGRAEQQRPTLRDAGVGNGAHGFEIDLPPGLAVPGRRSIELRATATGEHLRVQRLLPGDHHKRRAPLRADALRARPPRARTNRQPGGGLGPARAPGSQRVGSSWRVIGTTRSSSSPASARSPMRTSAPTSKSLQAAGSASLRSESPRCSRSPR